MPVVTVFANFSHWDYSGVSNSYWLDVKNLKMNIQYILSSCVKKA